LHADELSVDRRGVRELLATQFARCAALPLEAVASNGTDNWLFRLGHQMCVRLPRRAAAATTVEREWRWLPILAPGLPLETPRPLFFGQPGESYPFNWMVTSWIDGDDAGTSPPDPFEAAHQLAAFLVALRAIPTAEGPVPGPENFWRGTDLAARDLPVRRALKAARDMIDAAACERLWEACLDVPVATSKGWIHGDIHPGNLIVRSGSVVGVIDFGCMAIGDPACDLQCAWTLLDASSRRKLRELTQCDDAAWQRGVGWALSVALVQLPYYRKTSSTITRAALGAIGALLSEGNA